MRVKQNRKGDVVMMCWWGGVGWCYYAPQGHYQLYHGGEVVTGPGRHSPVTSNALLTPSLQGRTLYSLLLPPPADIMPQWSIEPCTA